MAEVQRFSHVLDGAGSEGAVSCGQEFVFFLKSDGKPVKGFRQRSESVILITNRGSSSAL